MSEHGITAAVFLDRDGTLIEDRGHLDDPSQVNLLEGVPEALRRLQAAGFKLVLVSNQSGVGRGWLSEAKLEAVHRSLLRRLAEHCVSLDAAYYCVHAPENGCTCRKPLPGLLLSASNDLKLDLHRSWMVGDKRSDAQAGLAAGARAILVGADLGGPWAAADLLGAAAVIEASAETNGDEFQACSGVYAVSPDELGDLDVLLNAERVLQAELGYRIPAGDAGHGISYSVRENLLFKRYRERESRLAIKALVLSSLSGLPVARGRAVLLSKGSSVLVQQFVGRPEENDGLDQARAALASLSVLHSAWKFSLGSTLTESRLWLWLFQETWQRSSTYVGLEGVDFLEEFYRRAVRRRPGDTSPRLDGLPDELVAELASRLLSLGGPRDPIGLAHGDAHLNNQHGSIWFDFDHVRWAPLSYDAARLLSHGLRFSELEWTRLAHFALTLWPEMTMEDLLRAHLHHCLTLAGAGLGASRPIVALSYLKSSRNAAACFNMVDIMDAVVSNVTRNRL
jgi:D-glycero-D-manno-heptose 1,7-bisphosphate phosphatase